MVNKNVKRSLLVLTCLIGVGFVMTPSWLWIAPFLMLYITHAVLWTDHFYYKPSDAYSWNFPKKNIHKAQFNGSILNIPDAFLSDHTVLLKVTVSAHFKGKIFDPFVQLSNDSNHTQQQYFERGCEGVRYLNITPSIEAQTNVSSQLKIEGKHCSIDARHAEIIAFVKPELTNKKVMIIAPHADDAEIAAFGLYKNTDSMVVTVTAGEAEPETFNQYSNDPQKTALLKGRARAWDSVTIPKWAGLKENRAINLGYFCKQLQTMHAHPDQTIPSECASVLDTRVFREFNSFKLQSDQHGTSSWQQLIADLSELLEGFQPDVVVTPHLTVDPHADHHYSTLAIQEALAKTNHQQGQVKVLFYANHLKGTDMNPFGPPNTLCSLPPIIDEPTDLNGVFSFTLNEDDQRDKILALEMNHDLRRPVRWKKWLRKRLQQKLIGRYQPDYGEDEFLRKAVRANEIFFY